MLQDMAVHHGQKAQEYFATVERECGGTGIGDVIKAIRDGNNRVLFDFILLREHITYFHAYSCAADNIEFECM